MFREEIISLFGLGKEIKRWLSLGRGTCNMFRPKWVNIPLFHCCKIKIKIILIINPHLLTCSEGIKFKLTCLMTFKNWRLLKKWVRIRLIYRDLNLACDRNMPDLHLVIMVLMHFWQKAWITSVQTNLSIGESSRPVNFQLLKNVLSDLVQ